MFSPYLVPHLYPLFTMAALTFFVLTVTAYRRISHAAHYPKGYFKLMRPLAEGSSREIPVFAEQASRNLINLFEVPVLFYVVTFLILEVRMQNSVTLGLSWAFVAGRMVHSAVHLYPNKVIPRMLSFLGSSLILLVLWIYTVVRLVSAA